jgi:CRP/FNR family transcriptional regulator, cyclic AMP receptor protein
MKTIADLIGEHRFFADLAAADRDVLAGCGRNVTIAAASTVMREGEPADVFWAIRSGRVRVGVMHPSRGLLALETLEEGDILGWSWLFAPFRWHFDAVADSEVHAVRFDAACLRDKCERDPRLGFALVQRFARVLDERLVSARLRVLDLYGDPVAR